MRNMLRKTRRKLTTVLSIAFYITISGCNVYGPSDESIKNDLHDVVTRECGNVNFDILSSLRGEGDSESIYQNIQLHIFGDCNNPLHWGDNKVNRILDITILYQYKNNRWELHDYWILNP